MGHVPTLLGERPRAAMVVPFPYSRVTTAVVVTRGFCARQFLCSRASMWDPEPALTELWVSWLDACNRRAGEAGATLPARSQLGADVRQAASLAQPSHPKEGPLWCRPRRAFLLFVHFSGDLGV